ncbi:transcription initiation factor TFIID 23-30kDa subunit-domain-containing protein [Chaetomidium leptoderma]|uniref:Transcription initiation factor TFIID subunit 10 n=1 Tax=Chaetomidium leptoderma TaxID=669021 RepID=A0AAN6VFW7_9PEZI|nr:transcription initiation factor TFIID 23-30kDa subunit-domain-containing protein [Chaetomidium leptoderma]
MAANPPIDNAEQMTAPAAGPNGTQPTTSEPTGVDATAAVVPAAQEARLPTRKDASLREFLNKMDDYAPVIPDAVTNYYMTRAGLPPPPQTDQRLARLLALATQKFIADIAADAYQYSRIRASNTSANNPMGNLGAAAGFPIPGQPSGNQPGNKEQGRGGPLGIQRPGYGGGGQGGSQNRTVLTMEDLGMAVGEFGVNVKRSEFYR